MKLYKIAVKHIRIVLLLDVIQIGAKFLWRGKWRSKWLKRLIWRQWLQWLVGWIESKSWRLWVRSEWWWHRTIWIEWERWTIIQTKCWLTEIGGSIKRWKIVAGCHETTAARFILCIRELPLPIIIGLCECVAGPITCTTCARSRWWIAYERKQNERESTYETFESS